MLESFFEFRKIPFPDGFCPPDKLSGMPPDTPLLVAFSGGADSSVLLHLVCRFADAKGARVAAVHIHHGIRGSEADRDEAFCKKIAADYGIPLFVRRYDVPAAARASGESIESTARKLRYEGFCEIMNGEGFPLLLTAHHADDNLETVLFHMMRGSGLSGLCGIPPKRDFGNGKLLRPLLRLSREEILAYATQYQIAYVTDSTNLDTSYTRNRIRAEILPLLSEVAARPATAVTRMTDRLRLDRDCLASLSDALFREALTDEGLARARLRDEPEALVSRVLLAYWKSVFPDLSSYDSCHLESLYRLLLCGTPGTRQSLPGGFGVVTRDFLYIKKGIPEKNPPQDFLYPLFPGTTQIPERGISVHLIQEDSSVGAEETSHRENIYNSSTQIQFYSAKIKGQLFVRPRKPGDRIFSRGMHRSLRTLINAAHLPEQERSAICVFAEQHIDGTEELLWVPSIAVRDGLLTPSDGPVCTLCITEELLSATAIRPTEEFS